MCDVLLSAFLGYVGGQKIKTVQVQSFLEFGHDPNPVIMGYSVITDYLLKII